MGMLDSFRINCKNCGSEIEFQSKSGPCQLNDYTIGDIAPSVAGDLDGQAASCPKCDTVVVLHTQIMIYPEWR